jgi:type I restriction enzyme M protein
MANTEQQQQLGKTLWAIADQLRGAMNADDFRDYMLSFLFLRYLSSNYEEAAKKELGKDYPKAEEKKVLVYDEETKKEIEITFEVSPLTIWYANNTEDAPEFEKQMRKKIHFVIKPQYLWSNISELARTQNKDLLMTLSSGVRFIETESFENSFQGLFSEINLDSEKLGKTYIERNKKLCTIITKIAVGIANFSTDSDSLGDAYEYLIGQFAAGSGKKAGEFYTPQQISTILSEIVTLDSQEPKTGKKAKLDKVLDLT